MRNPNKLKVFALADQLVIEVYARTNNFPKDEIFGLRSQIRRAAVSIPSNIAEGCGRRTEADYLLRFLEIAYGSALEFEYQLSLAHRLSFIYVSDYQILDSNVSQTSKCLNALIRSLRRASDS